MIKNENELLKIWTAVVTINSKIAKQKLQAKKKGKAEN